MHPIQVTLQKEIKYEVVRERINIAGTSTKKIKSILPASLNFTSSLTYRKALSQNAYPNNINL